MTVRIFTTPTCPWCAKAKEYFKSKRIPYTELNVLEDMPARQEMINRSRQMGVPVIDINGALIIGFDPEAIEKALVATPIKKAAQPKKIIKKKAPKKIIEKRWKTVEVKKRR